MSEDTNSTAAPVETVAAVENTSIGWITAVCLGLAVSFQGLGLIVAALALQQLDHTHSTLVRPAYSVSPSQEMFYLVDRYFYGVFTLVMGLCFAGVGIVSAWYTKLTWPQNEKS